MPTELTPEEIQKRFAAKAAEPIKPIPAPGGTEDGLLRECGQMETDDPAAKVEDKAPKSPRRKSRGPAKKAEPEAAIFDVRMKVKDLSAMLKKVLRARTGTGVLPILNCVRLEATSGWVFAAMTDLDVRISARSEFVENAGGRAALCVDAKRLLALVGQADGAEIRLTEKEGRLAVACEEWRAVLWTLPAEDFPPEPDTMEGSVWHIPEGRLRRMLELTAPAMSEDTIRYILNGVHVVKTSGQLLMEGTDGRVLLQCSVPAELTGGDDAAVVPAKAVSALRGLLGGGEDAAHFCLTRKAGQAVLEELLVMVPDGTEVWSKLIDGSYPNTAPVIPPPAGNVAELVREGWLGMLERAAASADRGSHGVGVEIRRDGVVQMRSAIADMVEWREARGGCTAAGSPERLMEFRANAEYLSLSGLPAVDTVRLDTGAGIAPLLFTARETSGSEELQWQMVLMPLMMDANEKGDEAV